MTPAMPKGLTFTFEFMDVDLKSDPLGARPCHAFAGDWQMAQIAPIFQRKMCVSNHQIFEERSKLKCTQTGHFWCPVVEVCQPSLQFCPIWSKSRV
mmetsp:Transcript_64097/g.78401  ORF Transcript_64097/g.78401 Transcript_64097/m.78401 type:complete len:96 (-) Transcript_64097:109-396(-)